MSGNIDTLSAARFGAYFCPAWRHQGHPGYAVSCDECNKQDLRCCIGINGVDLCLLCANKIVLGDMCAMTLKEGQARAALIASEKAKAEEATAKATAKAAAKAAAKTAAPRRQIANKSPRNVAAKNTAVQTQYHVPAAVNGLNGVKAPQPMAYIPQYHHSIPAYATMRSYEFPVPRQ